MELAHLYHLRTIITAKDSTKSLVEWAKLLHPTPALGGEPREKALTLFFPKEKCLIQAFLNEL